MYGSTMLIMTKVVEILWSMKGVFVRDGILSLIVIHDHVYCTALLCLFLCLSFVLHLGVNKHDT